MPQPGAAARTHGIIEALSIAANASWANTTDRQRRTAAATASFLARFEEQVDPLGVLEPEVRAMMAQHARRAYMLQLAERSAKARA
jgi:hypothetical protein